MHLKQKKKFPRKCPVCQTDIEFTEIDELGKTSTQVKTENGFELRIIVHHKDCDLESDK
jgi:hypothetical protein